MSCFSLFFIYWAGSNLAVWSGLDPANWSGYLFRPVTQLPFLSFFLFASVHELFTHACYRRRVIKMQGGGELKVTCLFITARCKCWMKHSLDSLYAPHLLLFFFIFLLCQKPVLFPLLLFFLFIFSLFSPLCVFFFFFFTDPPLPFIGFHAAYLPRTMIRPGDIVFMLDWGTNSPAHVGLPFISMRAWKIHPYLPRVVIFTQIRFAIWVLVGLGCRCFTISFPSLQAGFQRPRKKNKISVCLKRYRFVSGMTISQFGS